MKYFYLLVAATFLFASCNTKKEERANRNNVVAEQADTHNARNSVDYEGTYEGVYVGDLPTASGSGMLVTLSLSDGKYTKTVQYKDDNTKEVYKSEGIYRWNNEGNKITLEGEEAPNTYFVAEGQLYHLDMNGNRISGDLADKYILTKK